MASHVPESVMTGEIALSRTGASSWARWLAVMATAPLVMHMTVIPADRFQAAVPEDNRKDPLSGMRGVMCYATSIGHTTFASYVAAMPSFARSATGTLRCAEAVMTTWSTLDSVTAAAWKLF